MKKRIIYTIISVSTLLSGLSVAFYINQHTFLRGFAGDMLIVIFIYSSVKIVLKNIVPWKTAACVFFFALFVEFIQYTGLPEYFHPGSIITILTLGSTYDPLDIAAYGTGVVIIFVLDSRLIHRIKD